MMIQLLIFSGWVESDLIWHDLNPQEASDSRIVKNSGQSTTLSLIRRAY